MYGFPLNKAVSTLIEDALKAVVLTKELFIPTISIEETAAETWVALTRKLTAIERGQMFGRDTYHPKKSLNLREQKKHGIWPDPINKGVSQKINFKKNEVFMLLLKTVELKNKEK